MNTVNTTNRAWTRHKYSRTLETTPENAKLLDELVDTHVIPALQKRTAASGVTQSDIEEMERILEFGGGIRKRR